MFLPYNTDAPLYYWPIITIVIIVANVLIFVCEIAHPEFVVAYSLTIGDGLHPIQWLTHNFLHADILHLLGNMFAFWSFGLVVEGKIGPWKSTLIYLGIGIIHGFVVQILMLEHEPTCCLGASAIVFGMMAISLIWAPENRMDCFLLIYFRPFFFEVSIKNLVVIFLSLQILTLYLMGGSLSSEFLHIVGAIIGLTVGVTFLKLRLVNCEHWDIFSIWAGHHLLTDAEHAKREAETLEGKRRAEEREQKRQKKVAKHLDMILEEIRRALREGKPLPAFLVARKTAHENPRWTIPESELLQLIQSLTEKKHVTEAVEAMQVYLKHYAAKAGLVRLKLAQLYLEGNQPRTAMKALSQVDTQSLTAAQMQFYRNLRRKIEQQQTQDTYELADDV